MRSLVLCAALAVLLTLFSLSSGSVIGVDWGSEFIKITAPKGDQIDIVLNEQTRRKSNNFIGFRGEDRFLGEDAKNLAPRFPNNMFTLINRVAGVPFSDPERVRYNSEWYLTNKLVPNEKRGGVDFAIEKNPTVTYTSEELLAMMIEYMKDISEKDTGHNITTAVFTVPSFFTSQQRQAIVDAADLAGIRALALMHSTTATALQFGMGRRGFGNDTYNVLVYDMGATKAEVGVYTFTPTPQPKEGRVKLAISLGTMTTRAIVSDATLGGRTFDVCIAKLLEDEFIEKNPKLERVLGGATIHQQKATFTLMRAAQSAKETLSANTFTPVTVEALAPDRDFSTKVTRDTFEEKCASLFDRVLALAKRGVEASGLQLADLHSFELMGGGLRIPKIVNDLSAYLGRPVDRTINSDEAAAYGAGYYGARLASFFRVKSFDVRDTALDTVAFELSPPPANKEFSAKRTLFERSIFGSRRSIALKRTSDFALELFTSSDSGKTFEPFAMLKIDNVNETMSRLGVHEPKIVHENNTVSLRVQVRLDETGLISFEEGQAKYRYVVNASKKVRVNVTGDANATESQEHDAADSATNSSANDSGEDAADGAEGSDGGTNTTVNTTTAEPEKPKYKYETVYQLEMRRRTSPLEGRIVYTKKPLPMDADDRLNSITIMKAINNLEAHKRATSAAKNDLETYIQWAKREGILENDQLRELKFINDEEAESIRVALDAAQEWVEDGEGSYDSCTKEEFEKKLIELKNATSAVTKRVKAHDDHLAEIRRNETLAREKAAREAKKKASGKKAGAGKKDKGSKKTDEDAKEPEADGEGDAQETSGDATGDDVPAKEGADGEKSEDL